jgi:hypothetical protein
LPVADNSINAGDRIQATRQYRFEAMAAAAPKGGSGVDVIFKKRRLAQKLEDEMLAIVAMEYV